MKKRLLSALLALCMMLTMMPTVAFAAEGDETTADPPASREGNVAYIERGTADIYCNSLDTVIQEAQDGDTIVLLRDFDAGLTTAWGINKDLTITGNHTITFDDYSFGIHGNNTLTLDGCHIVINNAAHTAYSDKPDNAAIMLDQGATLTLNNEASLVIDSPKGDGIATWDVGQTKETLNILNGSFYELKHSPGGGVEDYNGDSENVYINIDNQSRVYFHDNYSGFIGTLHVTSNNSIIDVINNTGNGSNGSDYNLTDSTVTFNDNGSHGMSARDITMVNSTVNADNNGCYGVYTKGQFTVDKTSKMNVTNNSSKGDYAGLKITSGVTAGKVENGAEITITDM